MSQVLKEQMEPPSSLFSKLKTKRIFIMKTMIILPMLIKNVLCTRNFSSTTGNVVVNQADKNQLP